MRSLNKVIKASQYHSHPGTSPLPFSDLDQESGQQCQSVLDQAFQKAKQIVESAQSYSSKQLHDSSERAKEELREAKKQGYQDGFARGRKEGEKAGLEEGRSQGFAEGSRTAETESRKSLDELDRMIQSVEKSKTSILERFEADLVELALSIARAVLKRELETDPKTMHAIIQNAVDSYRNQAWVRIYVSGKTADLLTKADVSIAKELESVSEHVKVVVTPGLGDESCVIEMPDQVIDAGIDAQMRKIQTTLAESAQLETPAPGERES